MLALRPFQSETIKAFLYGACSYLALDAGLGKTRIAIEIAIALGAKRILVICPASVKISWVHELKKWAPDHKYHTPVTAAQVGSFEPYGKAPLWTIINYDKLARGEDFLKAIIEQGPYDFCVIDEAHYVKDQTAKRSRAIYRHIVPICKKVLPMSATPMTRSASDLYAPLRYFKPEAVTRNGRLLTLFEFQDRYTIVQQKMFNGRQTRVSSGSRNQDELAKYIGDFFYRKTKAECLTELPPMQFELMPIGLDRSIYSELAAIIGDDFDQLDDAELLEAVARNSHIMRAMATIGQAKVKPGAHYIKDYIGDSNLKCVVWAKHHDVIDALMVHLSEYNPARIDGRVSEKDRGVAVDRFLNDPTCQIFIGQITAAGTGLTLIGPNCACSDVFFIESEWSHALQYQAASRVHRQGQRNAVLVRTLVAQGVRLDMRVQALLNQKAKEAEELV